MDRLVYLLPAVGCAAMMGGMMWMMMRGNHHGVQAQQSDAEAAAEIAALRTEIAAVRADQDATTAAPTRVGGHG
jgi:hypothetical protein